MQGNMYIAGKTDIKIFVLHLLNLQEDPNSSECVVDSVSQSSESFSELNNSQQFSSSLRESGYCLCWRLITVFVKFDMFAVHKMFSFFYEISVNGDQLRRCVQTAVNDGRLDGL